MNGQQLWQASATLRLWFSSRAVQVGLATLLIVAALMMSLALYHPAPVTQRTTTPTAMHPTAWPIGTGSVYDGR